MGVFFYLGALDDCIICLYGSADPRQGLEQAKFNVDGKPLWCYKEVWSEKERGDEQK